MRRLVDRGVDTRYWFPESVAMFVDEICLGFHIILSGGFEKIPDLHIVTICPAFLFSDVLHIEFKSF